MPQRSKRHNMPYRKEARRKAAKRREQERYSTARDFYEDKLTRRGLAPELANAMPRRRRSK